MNLITDHLEKRPHKSYYTASHRAKATRPLQQPPQADGEGAHIPVGIVF